jgi:hypothetical protein
MQGASTTAFIAKKHLYSVCRPRGYAGAEEIGIFGPDGTFESTGGGENRPIILVTRLET